MNKYKLLSTSIKTIVFLSLTVCFSQNGCWKKVMSSKGASETFVIGLTNEGKLFGWGKNNYGQLGNGTRINTNRPQQIGSANDWKTFDTGSASVIALKNNGTLWTWGNGESIGHGEIDFKTTPVQVGSSSDWKEVFASDFNVYAIKNNGSLWACGKNVSGSLGNGNKNIQYNFSQIGSDSNWKQISGGTAFTVGLKTDGSLWTWGSNDSRQLGNGGANNFSDVLVPTLISSLNWTSISAGQRHVIALQANGTMWSWGSNSVGQLGIGSNTSKSVPTQEVYKLTNWTKVSAGFNHNSALNSSGELAVWGRNLYGTLGLGYDSNQILNGLNSPVLLDSSSDWYSIGNGSFNSVALKKNGDLYIWGSGQTGSIGNGTNIYEQTTPIKIDCPNNLGVLDYNTFNNILVYPNPFSDKLNIQTNEDNLQSLKIIDLQGRLIKQEKVSGSSYELNLETLPKATYILEIISDKTKQSVKVIKK